MYPKRRILSFANSSTPIFTGLVPLVGGLIGGSKAAYRYLPSSLTNFPEPAALAERFREAGFIEVRHIPLAGGAISIHVGAAP